MSKSTRRRNKFADGLELVRVRWEDITGHQKDTWIEDEDIKTIVCDTVGYVVKQSDRHLIVSQMATDDQSYGEVTAIPRGVILQIWNLGKGKVRK